MFMLQIEGLGRMLFDGGGLFVTPIDAICLTVKSNPVHEVEPKQ